MVAITLDATSMGQIALLTHRRQLFGTPSSDSTARRMPESVGRWSRRRLDRPLVAEFGGT
ncbi:hypothetical protein ACIBQ1_55000 [Nonomuraea sp. NPDC050153]|uniref:hypothetical protein n=1 Tax=Nonomuraea sp. NPDC050153 TaxID=3364359 RepID=UPI0037B1DF20